MMRVMLKAKIHRATVTDRCLDYEGSITIDLDLMDAVGLLAHEQVQVYNVTNGQRFETYAIAGARGTGTICVDARRPIWPRTVTRSSSPIMPCSRTPSSRDSCRASCSSTRRTG